MTNPKGRQTALKGQLTTLQHQLDGHATNPLTAARYSYIRDKLVEYTTKLEEINDEIFDSSTDAAILAAQQAEYNTIVEKILELTEKLELIPTPNPLNYVPPSGKDYGVKLPKIDLPTFGGDLQDWTSFYDLFVATIHNNKTLSKGQKLQYLKSSLKGEASTIIQALQITDSNYDEAWTLLKDRYNNKREIVHAFVKRLIHQSGIKEESSSALRSLIDTTNECTRALTVLGRPVDTWDDILVVLLTERLDSESRRQWILSLTTDDPPSCKDLIKFLDQRARALAEAGESSKPKAAATTTRTTAERKPTMASHVGSYQSSCLVCNGSHYFARCPEVLKLGNADRKNLVRKHSLCFNCLRKGHNSKDCSSGPCHKCSGRHHTILHAESPQTQGTSGRHGTITSHCSNLNESSEVLLSTALINIEDKNGSQLVFRALLDSGSQASFISETCAQRLGHHRMNTQVTITGIGSTGVNDCNGKMQCQVSSEYDKAFSFNIDAFILSKITRFLPNATLQGQWSHLRNIQLADPTFNIPGKIDVLLGADAYAELIRPGIRRGKQGAPTALHTALGWILTGKVNVLNMQNHKSSQHIMVNLAHCDLDSTLRRFWELEDIPDQSHLTPEEKLCESHFESTTTRDKEGRFVVRLPIRDSSQALGASRDIAIRRLKQMERKFIGKPELQLQYQKFMEEYLSLGHMQLIPSEQVNNANAPVYYHPHHAVVKEDSTKFRVVFDASAKTSNGISLNNILMNGPKLQDDIFPILIRFRFHQVAFSADVGKMYRQILVHPNDQDLQRIVWRHNSNEPIKDYRLSTVTYGQASAPYQALKCTRQLASEEDSTFPLASTVWLRDSYVDDIMSGGEGRQEALTLQTQLIEMMKKGGFDLRKWSSNDPALLESLPPEMRETKLPLSLDADNSVKTLGLYWHPASDVFSFTVSLPPSPAQVTKRIVLSDLSKTFDPLGWLSPTIIQGKIFFQLLWKLDLGWDDTLPEAIQSKWLIYRDNLPQIESIHLPRCIVPEVNSTYEVHGFCDSSELAYAAVVYLRCTTPTNQISVSLLAGKTKVAPLKKITLPRLELCSAYLLSRLLKMVFKSLAVQVSATHCWSDSTVVLSWLASPSDRWKTFVANRVSAIQDVIPSSNWHHVRSEDNPADCASRGIPPSELSKHPIWWNGPPWLKEAHVPYPKTPGISASNIPDCKSKEVNCMVSSKTDFTLLLKYSSLMKLQRITAYCLRFIHNLKLKPNQRSLGFLSMQELEFSLLCWIKLVQSEAFGTDLSHLRAKKNLSPKSRIISLSPFLDETGVLRVGGRLQNATIPEDQKHSIILPRSHPFTSLLIVSEHLRLLHAGPQLLLSNLRLRYWIICGRDAVRHQIGKCIICVRHRGATVQQLMGNLPTPRVTIDRPFSNTGIDYAGPFHLRVLKGRGQKSFKCYIALFICFSTRAIHLEAVTDLTSQGFIAALHRFVSRRGKCRELHSDCGTNFVGADKELKEDLKLTRQADFNDAVSRYLTSEGINWNFNPPAAPHQGGLWEAGVKSVKFHLRRVLGNARLDYEEFYTMLCRVEACLNSRPLCPITSDPSDMTALTPGHFLVGGPLAAIHEPDLTTLKVGRLARWQLVQQLVQQFWRRWTSEFLSRLQQRPKWWTYQPNLKVGDMVLVKDDQLPPLSWPLGRITNLHPGPDGLVRVVTVKTAKSDIKRPVTKICHLPMEQPES